MDKMPQSIFIKTAANLARLPPFDLECFDLNTLSQQVKEIRKGVKTEGDMNNLLVELPVIKAQTNKLLNMNSGIDKMKKMKHRILIKLKLQYQKCLMLCNCFILNPGAMSYLAIVPLQASLRHRRF